ncbi:hypothetical protein DFJ74DRAFT_648124 [Hyaloraphidium curvatum]|nr:hypothetical protein DFJ74DRAFT_648124 [Hyaloraphidium curvatum]
MTEPQIAQIVTTPQGADTPMAPTSVEQVGRRLEDLYEKFEATVNKWDANFGDMRRNMDSMEHKVYRLTSSWNDPREGIFDLRDRVTTLTAAHDERHRAWDEKIEIMRQNVAGLCRTMRHGFQTVLSSADASYMQDRIAGVINQTFATLNNSHVALADAFDAFSTRLTASMDSDRKILDSLVKRADTAENRISTVSAQILGLSGRVISTGVKHHTLLQALFNDTAHRAEEKQARAAAARTQGPPTPSTSSSASATATSARVRMPEATSTPVSRVRDEDLVSSDDSISVASSVVSQEDSQVNLYADITPVPYKSTSALPPTYTPAPLMARPCCSPLPPASPTSFGPAGERRRRHHHRLGRPQHPRSSVQDVLTSISIDFN